MINRILTVTVLGFLVSMGMATPSIAGFEMNNADEKVEVEAIPFVVALRKIVPIDYDFSFETDADLGQIVSYEYKGEWTDTLSTMLAKISLTYRVKDNLIAIYKTTGQAPAQVADGKTPKIKEEQKTSVDTLVKVKKDIPVGEPITKKNVPVIEEVLIDVPVEDNYIWKVRKGYTLQETVKSWGEQVGWTVVWDSDRDFEIQSEVSFSGSFVDAATGLINAFAEADPPVVGTFYKNNTLVIQTTSNGEVN